MRPSLLVASILALALSGCTGSDGGATQNPATTGPSDSAVGNSETPPPKTPADNDASKPSTSDANAPTQVAVLPEIRFWCDLRKSGFLKIGDFSGFGGTFQA